MGDMLNKKFWSGGRVFPLLALLALRWLFFFCFESTFLEIFEFSPTKNIGSPTIFDGLFFFSNPTKNIEKNRKNKKKPTKKVGFFCQSLKKSCHF